MNELVFVENGQAVTDSLTVADVFKKNHKDVMRDIRNLECSEEFNRRNFALIDYTDERNRTYKKFLIKRDGLAFLVMGYTGTKAAEYKEKYIAAFNEMEKQLYNSAPTERSQLVSTMKLALAHEEDLQQLKTDVEFLKEDVSKRILIDYAQSQALINAKNRRVESLWDSGTVNKEIHDTKRKLHAAAWKDLKNSFGVNSYHNIKEKDYQEAMNYITSWRPRLI